MEKDNLTGLSPLWLMSLAMVLGTMIVVAIPIAISGGETIKASDWIGFAGNVVAGVMTLIAAIVAWFAVQQQIAAQTNAIEQELKEARAERIRKETEAKACGVAAITGPILAAATCLYTIDSAIAATSPADISKWDNSVNEAAGMLEEAAEYFRPHDYAMGMSVTDRLQYLILLRYIGAVIIISKRKGNISRIDMLKRKKEIFEVIRNELPSFDQSLLTAFESEFPT